MRVIVYAHFVMFTHRLYEILLVLKFEFVCVVVRSCGNGVEEFCPHVQQAVD